MKIEIYEALWFDEHQQFSLAEVADLSGMSQGELQQLIDQAAFAPVEGEAAEARFSAGCVTLAQTARRLRQDFDLDANGLALALTLLERVRELEKQLQAMGARFPKSHH